MFDVATWPFVILVIAIVAIIIMITTLRAHPFVALIVVAILTGVMAPIGSLPGEPEKNHFVQAVEITTVEFGTICGRVGLVIALASIIGVAILESGAADKIVRRMLALFGEKRAGAALLTGGYPLGLPIFFDTFFMLLLPLARGLGLRTGANYTLFILAICCAGAVTHSMVAPHPGPLALAEILKVDLGWSIIVGTLVCIPAVLAGWQVSKVLNRKCPIPVRENAGMSREDLLKVMNRSEKDLPGVVASLLPVLLPIFLISTASSLNAFAPGAKQTWLYQLLEFAGNRNVALLIGAVLAVRLVVKYRRINLEEVGRLLGGALETAGVIILITSAGGAFGAMLNHAGVGKAIQSALAGKAVNMVLLAWTIAFVIRFAQGSATVAMLTAGAMMQGILASQAAGCHPMYLFAAIGFGALGISWMNDSGFWVISRLSGFTERETLRTWTVLTFTMSTTGLLVVFILSKLMPFI